MDATPPRFVSTLAPRRQRRAKPNPAPDLLLGRLVPQPARAIGFAARHGDEAAPASGLIRYAGDGHLMTIGSTGCGKGVGPVICNALHYPGSLIVIDVKGEVQAVTARSRAAMGQEVHIIDLRDRPAGEGALNPFDLARRGATELAVWARTLAADFIERTGHERDPFWNDMAETLLTGLIAHIVEDLPPEAHHPGTLFDLLHMDDLAYYLAVQLDAKDKAQNPAARAAFLGFVNLPERETRPSVQASAQHHLRLFDSQLVRRATETTSFDIDALIAGKPMTLYLIVPPHRLHAYRPLLRAWLTGLIMAFTTREAPPQSRTLLLCDEIGSLGRIDAFLTAATLLRGYGLTLWTFWQSAAQLEQRYGGDARTIIDNAGVIQLFTPTNRRAARDFCELVGGVDPDALMQMRRDEQLLLIDGGQPRQAKRLRYFEEARFRGLYDTNPLFGRPR